MQMATPSKKIITRKDWEKKLNAVDIGKQDMDKLVMNFLVAHSYEDAIANFIKESGTKCINRASIQEEILSGNIREAWSSLQRQYFQLCCEHPLMTFQMQWQLVIDHILNQELEKALNIVRESLAPIAAKYPHLQQRVDETYRLSEYEDPHDCALRELVNDSHFMETATVVNQTILTGGDQKKEAKLHSILRKLIVDQKDLNKKAVYPQLNISSGILEDLVI